MNKEALLIIDMQNDYFPGGANELVGAEKASQNAKAILERFRGCNKPVVHIQHVSTRPEATFFIPNTHGVEIHSNVSPGENELVITKGFPNSFINTPLLEQLKEKGVGSLVIVGMMTHMCVDATTRAAKDLGFTCTVIGDACATKDLFIHDQSVKAKDVQNAFLAALSYFYATVVTTEEYLKI